MSLYQEKPITKNWLGDIYDAFANYFSSGGGDAASAASTGSDAASAADAANAANTASAVDTSSAGPAWSWDTSSNPYATGATGVDASSSYPALSVGATGANTAGQMDSTDRLIAAMNANKGGFGEYMPAIGAAITGIGGYLNQQGANKQTSAALAQNQSQFEANLAQQLELAKMKNALEAQAIAAQAGAAKAAAAAHVAAANIAAKAQKYGTYSQASATTSKMKQDALNNMMQNILAAYRGR